MSRRSILARRATSDLFSPGTAMLFALTMVESLCGKEKRREVEGPMICADEL